MGLGLIITKIAELAEKGETHDEINNQIDSIIKSTSLYVVVKKLDYIVKGGRLPKWVKSIADFLNFRPIMTTKSNGKMGAAGIIKGKKNLIEKLSKFIINKLDLKISYNISIGHCNDLNGAKELQSIIQTDHNNIHSINIIDMGCALGVHAGPGSFAVGIQII